MNHLSIDHPAATSRPIDHRQRAAATLTPEQLAQRRRSAKRLAWVLGGVALLLYSAALSLTR